MVLLDGKRHMTEEKLAKLFDDMHGIWDKHMRCRALFPYSTRDIVGEKWLHTAKYYQRFGYNVKFFFERGITLDEVNGINVVGHFLNQNLGVRLCALLESYHVFSNTIKIDQQIPGWKELDLLRRLRHVFAHSSGDFNADNNEHQRLRQEMVEHFRLGAGCGVGFPLSVDTVLEPMFIKCCEYAQMQAGE